MCAQYHIMKIIDCFTFYNEIELLKYRLNILHEIVDYFVIAESTHTHMGNEKPLFFQENVAQFEQFRDKIIHVIVDDIPFIQPNVDVSKNQQWENEKFQRNCISRGIANLALNDNDYITVCDLDEIPDPTTLLQLKASNSPLCQNYAFEMDFYYYNLTSQIRSKWYLAKIIPFSAFKQFATCEQIRQHKCNAIRRGGWHLSYFGDELFVKNKLHNFAHQEFNNDQYTTVENIAQKIKDKTDLFGRQWNQIVNLPIKENDYLPPHYTQYLSAFV